MTGRDPATEQVSTCLGLAGCTFYVFTGFSGHPRPCDRPVTHAGLVLAERAPVELWLVFACSGHAGRVPAARELLDRDEQARAERAEQLALGAAGKPYQRPGPLATGQEARARFRRATAGDGDQE